MPECYELAFQTSATAAGAPLAEVMSAGTRPISVVRFALYNSAATAAARIELGRPGNTPAGGTAQTAASSIDKPNQEVASGGGVIIAGWGTAPTVPAAGDKLRICSLAAAIGDGVEWSWSPGKLVVGPSRGQSLILWNVTGVIGLLNCYVAFSEDSWR